MDDRVITARSLRALAAVVVETRGRIGAAPWHEPGVVDALSKASERQTTIGRLARAAIRAAEDPANRTPAVIALDGRHWYEPGDPAGDRRPITTGPDADFCRHPVVEQPSGRIRECGRILAPGETCDHGLNRTEARHETIARARRVLAGEPFDDDEPAP